LLGASLEKLFFGLNEIVFTHRNHKLNKQVQETQKQYAYLSVTYIQNDTQTLTMARWQIIVKTSEATKLFFVWCKLRKDFGEAV